MTARDRVASNPDHGPVREWTAGTSTGVLRDPFEMTDRHATDMIPGSADEKCGELIEWADMIAEEGEGESSYLVDR